MAHRRRGDAYAAPERLSQAIGRQGSSQSLTCAALLLCQSPAANFHKRKGQASRRIQVGFNSDPQFVAPTAASCERAVLKTQLLEGDGVRMLAIANAAGDRSSVVQGEQMPAF